VRTVFLVGGSPTARRPHHLQPRDGDFVIAADLGAEHARAWGWPLDLLVGDLDSLSQAVLAAETDAGTRIVRVPEAKDLTDVELALQYGLAEEPDAIVICAVLGGRTDHLLANVFLLARPELADCDVYLADGNETLRLLSAVAGQEGGAAQLKITGRAGDLLTLLPLGTDAVGVTTHALRYPLHDETLHQGEARGTSNVFEAEQAVVSLRSGWLLVVHIAKESD
jgi:thiamine pyrophosphokinase